MADMRFGALIAALLVYAAWGTPTPDDMGAAEIIVALLLVFAAGVPGIAVSLRAAQGPAWVRAGQGLLLYGATLPVLAGLAAGNDPVLMLRDLVAFGFMLLPLFFYGLVRVSPARLVVLTMAAVTVGLVFSWRVLVPAFLAQNDFDGILARMHPPDPAYLANAPTVLFAALLLMGLAGLRLYVAPRPRTLLTAFVLLAMGALPFVTMALILQRASIGLGLAGLALLLAIAFVKRPYRALPLLAVTALALAAAAPWLGMILADLAEKTAAVGFNRRWQEAAAVLDAVGGHMAGVLFGHGWGATIVSPAVGDYPVNFTHNLLTTYFLKTGLPGVAMVVVYIGALAGRLWPLLWARPLLAVALGVPLAIDTMLYASFKSLDFGLILLLLAVWGDRVASLQKSPAYATAEASPDPH